MSKTLTLAAVKRLMAAGGRGSGKTRNQLLNAPREAVFVWANGHLDYPRRLAAQLGRSDIKIVSPDWVVDRRWVGTEMTAVILDHDLGLKVRDGMLPEFEKAYKHALAVVRRPT